MRVSNTLVKSTAKYGYAACKGIYGSTTGGSRNGGGRVYPATDGEMLSSSYVTVISQRRAMLSCMFLGSGVAGESARGIRRLP
jgi:hypothetical protein